MIHHPASNLHWDSIPNFSESEFKGVDLTRLDERVVLRAQDFRENLGRSVFPSIVAGAFVRTRGRRTSRHYAEGRFSDAGDFFTKGHIIDAFHIAIETGYGGIGLYLDTQFRSMPWPMIHLDLRIQKAYWICEKINGQNVYTTFHPNRHPKILRSITQKLSEVKICHY